MIGLADAGDLAAIARLMADSALLQRYQLSAQAAFAAVADALADGDVVLCARNPSATLALDGLAWLSFAPRILNGAAYLRLLLVAVPSRGIGSRLLSAAEAHAQARANHLYLLASTDNVGARRFYERHGYEHVGDLRGLVLPDVDEALYHKPLRAPHARLRA